MGRPEGAITEERASSQPLRVARRYLDEIDEALPGVIEGFYLVGSVALGAFRPDRSDIDFVAVLGGNSNEPLLRHLGRIQRRQYLAALARTNLRTFWSQPTVCNGVFLRWDDLKRSPGEVVPIAHQVGGQFDVERGFEANPVTWWVLARRGLTLRGPNPEALSIHLDEHELRAWTFRNLHTYWLEWSRRIRRPRWQAIKAMRRQGMAWGVLGAPRLHYTLHTGEVVSKEQAGRYALDRFDARWHPLIEEALAYRRGEASADPYRSLFRRRDDTAAFVRAVIESAPGP